MAYKINTAVIGFGIGHFIQIADGLAKTTGTPTCKRTLNGTGAACANAAAYNTNGAVWEIDLDDTDINAAEVILSFALTGCIPISYTIHTEAKIVSDLKDETMVGTDDAALAASFAFTGTDVHATLDSEEVTVTDDSIDDIAAAVVALEPSDIDGSIKHEYVVTSSGVPVPDVTVEARIGDVTYQLRVTNSLGVATFYLQAGTYDFYARKAGYSPNNPDTETVA